MSHPKLYIASTAKYVSGHRWERLFRQYKQNNVPDAICHLMGLTLSGRLRSGTMLFNMRYNAVVHGPWHQCQLPNALGSLICAEDETSSCRAMPRLLPSASRNCRGKRTRCSGKSSCRALFSLCVIKAN